MKTSPIVKRQAHMSENELANIIYCRSDDGIPDACSCRKSTFLVKYRQTIDRGVEVTAVSYGNSGFERWLEMTPNNLTRDEVELLRGSDFIQTALGEWLDS